MASKGGSKTKGGLYWKKGKWEMVTVERKNGRLPGTEEDAYLRIPAILVPPVALVLGLGFYLFLPFIGFAMLLKVIATKIRRELQRSGGPVGEKLAHQSSGEKHTP